MCGNISGHERFWPDISRKLRYRSAPALAPGEQTEKQQER